MKRDTRCPNMNHGRLNAPVRHCPMCGEIVNKAVSKSHCDDAKHAARRKERNTFCHDCGKKLTRD
ncbi:hypothetical protein [Bdellovibrio sp.]|uniref:hypothetical protein n=1 Tax=Bdellovibrio sp. TaxID=28201 RepID=UPI0039E56E85